MAIDLSAIKRKIEELNGKKNYSSIQMFKPKPKPGETLNYKVRTLCSLPSNTKPGEPWSERWFYTFGGNWFLAPKQFGMPDPVAELMAKLYQTKKEEDKALAKLLRPKMRVFVPIVDRAEMDKGVQIWSIGKEIYDRLLSFFADEDYQDITDPYKGFDLKVQIKPKPNTEFFVTDVDVKNQCKLASTPEETKKLLDSVPDINTMYKLKTYAEIEKLLNDWLNSSDEKQQESDGTTLPTQSNVVESKEEVEEVVEEKQVVEKKRRKVETNLEEVSESVVKKNSLDDVFAELEQK